jgi:hypothetical protein
LYQVDVVMMKSIGLDVPLCGTNRSGWRNELVNRI